ncbi:hypothetical protein GUITHDRAFT_118249 [Guillardia theta CCMP2712]|uniref:Cyclic nucleotide-binding domain-containing protein n=1 Tax=Guillardia theta (strain CCMP2712) TaxID=905079 RepID=L1II95_GUITC|nr:hypothetical protein GUITHDRAFT_118249 [Guillardia theta CCMP2712]EKX35540.1 hypothetical protein GUITHDRAFT_118249 [Guillardia theta CCMP2712]|eukprot:XP_005822520.1 hypothetical protein GUITHDRAFT_118249 [Guillardia theta CCMP2712]
MGIRAQYQGMDSTIRLWKPQHKTQWSFGSQLGWLTSGVWMKNVLTDLGGLKVLTLTRTRSMQHATFNRPGCWRQSQTILQFEGELERFEVGFDHDSEYEGSSYVDSNMFVKGYKAYLNRMPPSSAEKELILSQLNAEYINQQRELAISRRRNRENPSVAEGSRQKMNPIERVMSLQSSPILKLLSDEERQTLARICRPIQYQDGDVVIEQGAEGERWMYMVVAGVLSVMIGAAGDQKEVAKLGKGQIFGEMGMLLGEPRSATIKACGVADLILITYESFSSILRKNLKLTSEIESLKAERIQQNLEKRKIEFPSESIFAVLSMRRSELLKLLHEEHLMSLAQSCPSFRLSVGFVRVRKIDGKRSAAYQGDTNQPYCFILLKGNIAVLIRGEDQLEKEVAQMGEGAVVGEMSLLHNDPRSATVLALVQTDVLMVDDKILRQILEDSPDIREELDELREGRRAENLLQSAKVLLEKGMFKRALSASEQATGALERFRRKAEALVEARRFCDEIRQHLHGGGNGAYKTSAHSPAPTSEGVSPLPVNSSQEGQTSTECTSSAVRKPSVGGEENMRRTLRVVREISPDSD